mmetsp:Transcript_85530/g.128162  ORF Transcript_85530/g.128162 Transcript_85530/m.128162 type:complete len:110 (+) Transcript_85530:871-1200(+)
MESDSKFLDGFELSGWKLPPFAPSKDQSPADDAPIADALLFRFALGAWSTLCLRLLAPESLLEASRAGTDVVLCFPSDRDVVSFLGCLSCTFEVPLDFTLAVSDTDEAA